MIINTKFIEFIYFFRRMCHDVIYGAHLIQLVIIARVKSLTYVYILTHIYCSYMYVICVCACYMRGGYPII